MNRHLLFTLLFSLLASSKINAQLTANWETTFSGIGDFGDQFNAVATDANDNIYVTGYSVNPNSDRDLLIAKYNSSSQLQWKKVFTGTGNGPEEGKKILLHPNGNLIVVGYVNNKSVGNDFFTVIIQPNGDTVWTKVFNNPSSNLYDEPNAITVDAQGNIILVGDSDSDPSPVVNNDYLIVKYNSTGSLLWYSKFNSAANNNDRALSVVSDPSNNIIVAGRSNNGTDDDFVTIKYNSSGVQQWSQKFDNGGNDRPVSIGIDQNGKIYVAGRSNNGTDDDFRVIQYNSSGVQQFNSFYDVAGHDRPVDMVVLPSGGCIVTGRCDGIPGTGIEYNIHTVSFTSGGLKSWVGVFKGSAGNDDIPTAIKLANNGSVIVTGYSDADNTGLINNDLVFLQYSNTGVELINQIYKSFADKNDEGKDLVQLKSGNYVLVGSVANSSDQRDAVLLIYQGNNKPISETMFSGIGDNSDNIRHITSDATGNLYYCGYSVNKDLNRDFCYGKLDPSGKLLWEKDTSGSLFGSDDEANAVAIDPNGNIIISGVLKNSGTSSDIYVEKISNSGNRIWNLLYDGPLSESDRTNEMVVNNSGDIYLVGKSDVDASWQVNDDILLLKVSSTGTLLWKTNYSSSSLLDKGQFIRLNSSNEIIIAGQLQNGINDNAIVIKYNASGTVIWSKIIDVNGGNDKINDVIIDPSGNIYISGQSQAKLGSFNYNAFICCINNSGQQVWLKTIGNGGTVINDGVSLALGIDNSIWLTGNLDSDTTVGINLDVFLMNYDKSGNELMSKEAIYSTNYSDEVDDIEIIDNGIPCVAIHTNTAGILDVDFSMNLLEFKNGILSSSYQRNISDTIDIANKISWNSTLNQLFIGGSTFSKTGQRDFLLGNYRKSPSTINQISENQLLEIYPNPVEDEMYFKNEINGDITIYNLNGAVLLKANLEFTNKLDLSHLSSGFYVIEIRDSNKKYSTKFIKK